MTTNGGTSWSALNADYNGFPSVTCLTVDPTDTRTVYAGCLQQGAWSYTFSSGVNEPNQGGIVARPRRAVACGNLIHGRPAVITWQLNHDALVTSRVYNSAGELVVTQVERKKAGPAKIHLDLAGIATGVYYCRLTAQDIASGGVTQTDLQKLVVIR